MFINLTFNEMITVIISIISLFISIYFAATSARQHKFNLVVEQLHDGHQSGTLLSYDGSRAPVSEMTGQPHSDQLALIRIVLVNKSASPISIISFHLGDENGPEFADYSHTEPYFVVTTGEKQSVLFGYKDQPLDYLLPIINLDPYEGKSGYLLFPIHDVFGFDYTENIELIIKTSRKNITKSIKFGPVYESIESTKYTKVKPVRYYSK